jgi:malate synthase
MMMQKGVYEYLVENNKKRFLSLNGIVIEERLVEDKNDVKHAEITHFMEAEKEINAKKEQLEKESDLTSHTLDKWHKSKKGEIDANPEQFFNEQ